MEQWYYLLRTPIDNLDIGAQQLVYRSFYQLVYSDIYFLLRDSYLTEDIIQDSFVKAAAQAPKLRSDANIPGWLKQVARRTALDKLKKIKKDRQMLSTSNVIIDNSVLDEISVARTVETKMRNERLRQAMDELKPDYRTMLLMFYLEGKSYKDICQELNMTETVLTQRMARARKKLLQHFLRKWADDVNE